MLTHRNKSSSKQRSSKYRGVYKCGKKWKAQIQIDGIQHYLGVYSTEEEAAMAYNQRSYAGLVSSDILSQSLHAKPFPIQPTQTFGKSNANENEQSVAIDPAHSSNEMVLHSNSKRSEHGKVAANVVDFGPVSSTDSDGEGDSADRVTVAKEPTIRNITFDHDRELILKKITLGKIIRAIARITSQYTEAMQEFIKNQPNFSNNSLNNPVFEPMRNDLRILLLKKKECIEAIEKILYDNSNVNKVHG